MKLSDWLASVINDPKALSEISVSEDRIRRAYAELLVGYTIDVDSILNETVRVPKYDGIIEVEGIEFISLCGHHFLPFFGTATVRYVPNKIVTGLGKIPRVVDALARRCQIQEVLTSEIALVIERCISAKSVEVETQALHLCMHGRGPRSIGATTVCTYSTGSLVSDRGASISTQRDLSRRQKKR